MLCERCRYNDPPGFIPDARARSRSSVAKVYASGRSPDRQFASKATEELGSPLRLVDRIMFILAPSKATQWRGFRATVVYVKDSLLELDLQFRDYLLASLRAI
jgi:hypothetical protein